jgi:hypothetical protein
LLLLAKELLTTQQLNEMPTAVVIWNYLQHSNKQLLTKYLLSIYYSLTLIFTENKILLRFYFYLLVAVLAVAVAWNSGQFMRETRSLLPSCTL